MLCHSRRRTILLKKRISGILELNRSKYSNNIKWKINENLRFYNIQVIVCARDKTKESKKSVIEINQSAGMLNLIALLP